MKFEEALTKIKAGSSLCMRYPGSSRYIVDGADQLCRFLGFYTWPAQASPTTADRMRDDWTVEKLDGG